MDENSVDIIADEESRWRLAIRVLCIAIEVILVLWLGKQGSHFLLSRVLTNGLVKRFKYE